MLRRRRYVLLLTTGAKLSKWNNYNPGNQNLTIERKQRRQKHSTADYLVTYLVL